MPEWITKYWGEWLFGLLTGAGALWWGLVKKRLRQRHIRRLALEAGMCALLREEMIRLYEAAQSRGYCPLSQRERFDAMYAAYHDLGGNGTITELRQRLHRMETGRGRTDLPE